MLIRTVHNLVAPFPPPLVPRPPRQNEPRSESSGCRRALFLAPQMEESSQ